MSHQECRIRNNTGFWFHRWWEKCSVYSVWMRQWCSGQWQTRILFCECINFCRVRQNPFIVLVISFLKWGMCVFSEWWMRRGFSLVHSSGLSACQQGLHCWTRRQTVRPSRVVKKHWIVEFQRCRWKWVSQIKAPIREQKSQSVYPSCTNKRRHLVSCSQFWNQTHFTDCRFWMNLCQSVHDSPDASRCSREAAVCRRSEAENRIEMLGTVRTQSISYGEWIGIAVSTEKGKQCFCINARNVMQQKFDEHVLDAKNCFTQITNSWLWNILMATKVPAQWGNVAAMACLPTSTYFSSAETLLGDQKSSKSKKNVHVKHLACDFLSIFKTAFGASQFWWARKPDVCFTLLQEGRFMFLRFQVDFICGLLCEKVSWPFCLGESQCGKTTWMDDTKEYGESEVKRVC